MSKKIEIIDGSLVVTDTISSKVELDTPKRDVYIDSDALIEPIPRVVVYDTNAVNKQSSKLFEALLSVCVDSSLTAFTDATLRAFYRTSLGFNAASGGSGAFVTTVGAGGQSVFNVGFDLLAGFKVYLNGVINENITANSTISGTQQVTTSETIDEFTIIRIENP